MQGRKIASLNQRNNVAERQAEHALSEVTQTPIEIVSCYSTFRNTQNSNILAGNESKGLKEGHK
ncbi:hypothetical protein X975_12103, partial [Stegodyphus mimosarum]